MSAIRAKKWQLRYPPSEGWMRMAMTMVDRTPLGLAAIQKVASLGKPEEYEFGECTQYGREVVVHLRRRTEAAVKV